MDNYIVDLNNSKSLFFIEVDGEIAAEMKVTFESSDRIIIEHTLVRPNYKGKGFGKVIVDSLVDYARDNGIKIIPRCEYAKSVFEKTPNYVDVLIIQ